MNVSHESHARPKASARLKNFGSVVLLLVGWFLLQMPVGVHITLWSLDVPAGEHQRTALRYTLPCVVLGSLLIWLAARLRSRWRMALGIAAVVLGIGMFQFEEAIPVYRELVQALPNNAGPIMNLGLALHVAGREQEAVSQFQRVLKLESSHLPARLLSW